MANILLVEDDAVYRELLRTLCEGEGHFVLETSDAEEALQVIGHGLPQLGGSRRLDLLIVDFSLGGLNGYELVSRLRQRDELRRVPMMMMSGVQKDLRTVLRDQGVDFLAKPAGNVQVIEAVRRLLDGSRKAAPVPLSSRRIGYASPRRRRDSGGDEPGGGGVEVSLADLDSNLRRLAAKSGEGAAERAAQPPSTDPPAQAAESPVAKIIDQIIDKALAQRASDIHFEPLIDVLRIRTRIDGTLQPLACLPAALAENLAVRIKILCGLDMTEKRLPQDGQFTRPGPGGACAKFRVSTLPAIYGEKIVLRILPSGASPAGLDSLGYSTRNREALDAVLRSPTGLILVTGPTGSGKTTTLYTMLESLNTPQRNIVTVEDPVEYQLSGITQVQVNAAIGYTFEKVLRSFLRQDPNVMLVGEIRDAETADIALKAAVTGHLVLSTLHTNDAVSTIHRLLSMGLPSYLVAAACRLVIGQRLIRLLCANCKTAGALAPEEIGQLREDEKELFQGVWRARGCSACQSTGYSGRRAICEVLPMHSDELRRAVVARESPVRLQEIAVKEGLVPMRREALGFAAQGLTSPEEAFSALYL